MRELGLGLWPPWALAYVWPLDLFGYHRLDRWGLRVRRRVLASYFAGAEPEVGELSA